MHSVLIEARHPSPRAPLPRVVVLAALALLGALLPGLAAGSARADSPAALCAVLVVPERVFQAQPAPTIATARTPASAPDIKRRPVMVASLRNRSYTELPVRATS